MERFRLVADLAVYVVVIAVVSIAGPAVRARLAARRRRRVAQGRTVRVAVRARGGPPFPRWWGWGSVGLRDRPPRFRRWHRLGGEVPLAGVRVLRTELAAFQHVDQEFVVFHVRHPAGSGARLAVADEYATLFERALREAPADAPEAPAGRFARWTLVPAALAVLWVAWWVYLAVAGTPVTATVLANDEDYCRVEWQRGGRQEASVDCYEDERPGDRLRVVALPPPMDGEAADYGNLTVGVPIGTAVLLLPLGASYALRARQRRRAGFVSAEAPGASSPAAAGAADPPPVEPWELRWTRIAEAITHRAADEEWDLGRERWWLRAVRRPLPRLVLRSLPGLLAGPLLANLFAALVGWTAFATLARHDAGRARETVGVVEVVDAFVPLAPYDVELAIDDRTVRVTMLREPDVGDRVAIRYDAATGTARTADQEADGTTRAAALSGAVAAAALALLAWRSVALARGVRALRAARRAPAVPMRYAVVLDAAGDPALLLFRPEGDPRPEVRVAFDTLPADLPVAGDASVRGEVRDGGAVVVEVGGRLLYPRGPAEVLDQETLHAAVNGDLLGLDGAEA